MENVYVFVQRAKLYFNLGLLKLFSVFAQIVNAENGHDEEQTKLGEKRNQHEGLENVVDLRFDGLHVIDAGWQVSLDGASDDTRPHQFVFDCLYLI